MPNTYDHGDKVRLSATWTDLAGAAIDPASVYMLLRWPGGAGTYFYGGAGASIVRDGSGQYHVDLLIASYYPGPWSYRFVSKTANEAAEEQTFSINQSAFSL